MRSFLLGLSLSVNAVLLWYLLGQEEAGEPERAPVKRKPRRRANAAPEGGRHLARQKLEGQAPPGSTPRRTRRSKR